MTRHVTKVSIITFDETMPGKTHKIKKVKCSITGEYEYLDNCKDCHNFVRMDVVSETIFCRR